MVSRMIPVVGSLERILLDAMIDSDHGVTFLDFVGTGITEENIEQIVNNLRTGMFVSEQDDQITRDD